MPKKDHPYFARGFCLQRNTMARKRRIHKLVNGKTKKANHGRKPCRGKAKGQL
ncbi:MAG: hypothetical protein HQL32_05110 [Planctomycetes bacterium]|nr:hypothetical protein [Planctomycetota bacterium]